MLVLDGAGAPRDNTIISSIPQLRRDVEMWRARAFFLEKEKIETAERHNRQIAGMKRKHEEALGKMAAELKEGIEAVVAAALGEAQGLLAQPRRKPVPWADRMHRVQLRGAAAHDPRDLGIGADYRDAPPGRQRQKQWQGQR